MPVSLGPATARTDNVPAPPDAAGPQALVRRAGAAVTAGAVVWATSMVVVGNNPESSLGITFSDLLAVPFQLGLFALVTAQLRTRATGTSRVARGMLRVEYLLLSLATIWSLAHGLLPGQRDAVWLAVLDVFWPLSMLGMCVIGVKIAFTGRWRGAARIWPAIAESWALVTIPVMGVFGPAVGDVFGAAHLLVGYATLGLILALRPALTGAR